MKNLDFEKMEEINGGNCSERVSGMLITAIGIGIAIATGGIGGMLWGALALSVQNANMIVSGDCF